jgi:hypothetical protein
MPQGDLAHEENGQQAKNSHSCAMQLICNKQPKLVSDKLPESED